MSLKDITNLPDVLCEVKGVTKHKRLSNGTYRQYHYAKSRRQFEIVFDSDAEKVKFENKLENYKTKYGLGSMKSKKISNDQELIQSDPISCPQNQKGNN